MNSAPRVTLGEPGWTIAGRHFSQWVVDVVVAVLLACIGVVEVLRFVDYPGADNDWSRLVIASSAVMVAVSCLSLIFRRFLPMVVLVVSCSSVILTQIGNETAAGWGALMIGCFSAGMQGPRRRNVVLGFATLLAVDLVWWIWIFGTDAFDPILPGVVVIAAGFFWAGSALRQRTQQAADFQADTVRLELEREHAAERAAADERARIARELHDVIAHSLSVVVIQAEAAKRTLDSDPERARESLDAVERTGRSAMLEMRRLLGVVRRDDEEAAVASRVPQPSVAELDRVVADMRQAGLDVTLRVEGESRELPVGVDVSAYRIVQEALTNVSRHSPTAKAEVVIRYEPDILEIAVEDDGGGTATPTTGPRQGPGHGLVGMRERVSLLRGRLEAGPRPEAGFAVRASLPTDS